MTIKQVGINDELDPAGLQEIELSSNSATRVPGWTIGGHAEGNVWHTVVTRRSQLDVQMGNPDAATIFPMPFARRTIVDKFGMYITTALTPGPSSVKLALWRDNGKAYPGELVSPPGVASELILPTGVTEIVELALSPPLDLAAGLYWFGLRYGVDFINGKYMGAIAGDCVCTMGWHYVPLGSTKFYPINAYEEAYTPYASWPLDPFPDPTALPTRIYFASVWDAEPLPFLHISSYP